ncbi:hypothetical protein DL96DRAFT_1812153 [Flagelloscypha sp. PMI_526]|nr:hypothetical protein DL96DRAFT_1812153 [Flagelloscypha sp. PMI_526]
MPAITPASPLYALTVYVLGGWASLYLFIGGCMALFLFGVLCSQMFNYFTHYQEDKLGLKLVVSFLGLLSILKLAQIFAIMWIHNILWGTDPAGAAKLQNEWYELVNIPIGAVIAFYVQAYYVYRLWILSRLWWALVPVVIVMCLGLSAAMITAATLAKTGKSSNWFAVYNTSSFVTDILITVITTYFLYVARKKVMTRSKRMVDSLIRLAVQTAVPASICTLLMLICSRLGGKSLLPRATNAVILGLLQALPVIYANSMMYILNTRRTLRLGNSSGQTSSNPNPSNALRARQKSGQVSDHELGTLSGIHISTTVDTSRDNHYTDGKLAPFS